MIYLHNGNLLVGSQHGIYQQGSTINSNTVLTEIDTFGVIVKTWEDFGAGERTFAPCNIIELPNTARR